MSHEGQHHHAKVCIIITPLKVQRCQQVMMLKEYLEVIKGGKAHTFGEFLPDHGRVRSSTCSLMTSVGFVQVDTLHQGV